MGIFSKNGKIYLDENQKIESEVNLFLNYDKGMVEFFEYREDSGYGNFAKIFFCEDTKAEVTAIIRQSYNPIFKRWYETSMFFDSDSFEYLKNLIKGEEASIGGERTILKD